MSRPETKGGRRKELFRMSEIKYKKIQLTNSQNENVGTVSLEHLWADVFAVKIKIEKLEALNFLEENIRELLKEARYFRASQVIFRIVLDDNSSAISLLISKLGFKKKNERVEYKKQLAELPDDTGSPLVWKAAEELGLGPSEIAITLKLVAEGDPGTDPNEDPLTFIQDFLADPVLTSGLKCIHIGFIDNKIATFSVVQINPKTGWSRISYMGIVPSFRSQSLGVWVHRYSFKVMKEQGGKFYHGGTVATNKAMIRLFEKHHCDLFCKMEEWDYFLNAGVQ